MKNHLFGLRRREFLTKSAKLAGATMFLSLGSSKIFGTLNSTYALNSIPTVALNNGIPMPMLGFGTNTLKGARGVQCVTDAISVGYRLIDTATIYGNEESVGEGIKQSGIKREELFIT